MTIYPQETQTEQVEEICKIHGVAWRVGRNMANAPIGRYCSWDGSMHPDEFMAYLTKPDTQLTPTDKNYKVYIEVASNEQEQMRVIASTSRKTRPGDADGLEHGREWMPYEDAVKRHPELHEEYQRHTRWVEETTPPSHPWRHEIYWVQVGPRGNRRESKFYFEHLSDEQKEEFIRLLNDGKLNLAYPGHFYRLPFFAMRG